MTTGRSPGTYSSAWGGWIIFAAAVMFTVGAIDIIQGIAALAKDEVYLVAESGLLVTTDYTAWGWTYLIGGIILIATGAALLAGQTWARIVGVGLALLSAVLNMAFFAAYPWWSAIMITVDTLVIWALTVHGREMKAVEQR